MNNYIDIGWTLPVIIILSVAVLNLLSSCYFFCRIQAEDNIGYCLKHCCDGCTDCCNNDCVIDCCNDEDPLVMGKLKQDFENPH